MKVLVLGGTRLTGPSPARMPKFRLCFSPIYQAHTCSPATSSPGGHGVPIFRTLL